MAIILANYGDVDYHGQIRRHGTTPTIAADDDVCYGERPEWHIQAACRGLMGQEDAPNWFPSNKAGRPPHRRKPEELAAKAICAGCPVRTQCLAWSLEQDAGLDGIWAGLDEHDRRVYRREHQLAIPGRPIRTGPGTEHGANGWTRGCGCPTCHEGHQQRLELRRTKRAQTSRKQKAKGRAA